MESMFPWAKLAEKSARALMRALVLVVPLEVVALWP